MDISGRHILVIGLGATGLSGLRYLSARGATLTAVDSRDCPPALDEARKACPQARLITGGLDPSLLDAVDGLLVSPGVDLREPLLREAVKRGFSLEGDIEWFAREASAPVLAITGSNGKSTVTALLAEMAREAGRDVAVGGNFGTPALDLLAGNPDCYVLELSSFQLELCHSLRPLAATVLNVSADHMDRHGSLEHYAAIKARIFNNAELAVVNADDSWSADMGGLATRKVAFAADSLHEYGLTSAESGIWLMAGGKPVLPAGELKIRGQHNFTNALAALALADALGLPRAATTRALRRFPGLAHRCQWVASIDGVDWVNDSKGTNVGAMLASLEGLPGPVVLLAGGQAKGGNFSEIGPVMARKGRMAVLFGEDAALLESALAGHVPVHCADSFPDAISAARRSASAGDTVLLSPGCASFDMFRDYRERGDHFAAAVLEMAA